MRYDSGMTRRDMLLGTLGGMTSLPLASFAVAESFVQSDTQALVDKGFEAQRRGDFATMANCLRRAVQLGRKDEGVLRGLAFANCQLGEWKEAITVALKNHSLHGNEWSYVGVCETYASAGETQTARRWLRQVSVPEQLGAARPIYERAFDQVAIKTYQVTYRLSAPLLRRHSYMNTFKGDFMCHVPLSDLPFQNASYEVIGAKATVDTSITESKVARITPNGNEPFEVRMKVVQTPLNLREQARDFLLTDLPESVKRYTRATPDMEVDDPLLQATVAPLRSSSGLKTIENVLAWADKNMAYEGGTQMEPAKAVLAFGGSAKGALQRRRGHCEGRTSTAVALLRAAGVPSRFVRGFGGVVGPAGVPSMHSWTELFVPSLGWTHWDYGNQLFVVPTKLCMAHFRYLSPFSNDHGWAGDPDSRVLFTFANMLMDGADQGTACNVEFKRTSMTLQ